MTSGATAAMIPESVTFRLLEAERVAWAQAPYRPLSSSLQGVQEYVDDVTRTRWWSTRAPYRVVSVISPRKVQVVLDPQRLDSFANITPNYGYELPGLPPLLLPTITLSSADHLGTDFPHCRNPWVILHQLSHVLANTEGHSPAFTAAYKASVEHFLGGPSARVLREHLDARNVKWIGYTPKPR